MPISEFHRAATKKFDPSLTKTTAYTSDVPSFEPDDEFVELLWENSQIVMQGQSNRPKNSSYSKVEDKNYRDPTIQKFDQLEELDSTVSLISPSVPCSNIGSNAKDDDMDPWITYPTEDPFSLEFFSEFVGISPNRPLIKRNNRFVAKDLHNVEIGHNSKALREVSEHSKLRGNQCLSSVVNNASKPLGESNGLGVMNFSNFLMPASIARANSESLYRLKMNEKVSLASASTNRMESTLIQSSGARGNSAPDLHTIEQFKANNQNNTGIVANNISISSDHHINHQSSSFAASIAKGKQEAEKGPEAIVASSICPGNSTGAASNDPKHGDKRKDRDVEEFGYHSEDHDDEWIGLKKPVTGRGGSSTKRTRAAEVHNLSERRRRDRINEKMRALQELIPNCNKVDKTSMLDEAIEYLKTLQLQVQMMSMGNGLCMPPMMLPPGMQHIHGHPIAHFSPMSMGMSYGMGLLDMNGSPNCPLIPVPSMDTSQFPYSSILGTSGFQMPGSMGVQLFGFPGQRQGFPVQESNTEATMDQLRTSREN